MQDEAIEIVYKDVARRFDTDIAAQVVVYILEHRACGNDIKAPPLQYGRSIGRKLALYNRRYDGRFIPFSQLGEKQGNTVNAVVYGSNNSKGE